MLARLALLLFLGLANVSAPATSQENDDGIEISITVLPPEPRGTVYSTLASVVLAPVMDNGLHTISVDLVVTDHRGNGTGWDVLIQQLPAGEPGDGLWLTSYSRAADHGDGRQRSGIKGPREHYLAVAQSLHRPTLVFTGFPGHALGTHWIQFETATTVPVAPVPSTLVVTIPSAP